ncbi:LA_1612 family putative O-antigen biosynthesis protein [Candidatus Pelagibacter sp. HIMB1587]|uniref:LA_1612 family putative O-antigen biosynthesis protein n=1 Tax=Candidatus Pelagibacter sp. HIMB1587 TaxID=3413354 RepID=UPI003F85B54C
MIRFYNFILRLLKAKWIFKIPSTTDILIYDKVGSENIIPLINKKYNYEILNSRFETINFFIFFKSLATFFNYKIQLKHFYKNYLIKFIKVRKPKIIVTFIDNDFFFYSLKKKFPEICFICIQNGLSANKISKNKLLKMKKIDFFFCFSEIFAIYYKKFIARKTHIIGSLKCNKYRKKNLKKTKNKLIYISSYSDFKKYTFLNTNIPVEKVFKPELKLLPIIYNFCLKQKIPLSILLKTNQINKEKNFYLRILKNKLKIINFKYLKFYQKTKARSSYEIIKDFETVISIDSALGIEAINYDVKSIFFSIRGKFFKNENFEFGWPKKIKKEGFCWTNNLSEKKINHLLKQNLNLTLKEWKYKAFQNNFKRIMFYDYKNRTAKKIFKNITLDKVILDKK